MERINSKTKINNIGRACKACSASFREEIDARILNREPWRKIQNFCDDRGLTISTTALGRHARNHVANYTQPPQSIKVEYECEPGEFKTDEPVTLDRSSILRDLGFDESILANPTPGQYYELITKSLDRLTVETYLSAIGAMHRYQSGSGRFPSEQVNTLDRLTRISNALVARFGIVNSHDPSKLERIEGKFNKSPDPDNSIISLLQRIADQD